MNIGTLIGGSFGLVYVLVNAPVLGTPIGLVLQVAGVVAFVALMVLTFRRRLAGPGERPHLDRYYWLVVLAEVVAIYLGSRVLVALELPPLPWVTIVVGLHFVPLARMWRAPALGRAGVVLALLGAAGLVAAIVGAGPAVVALLAGVLPGAFMLGGLLWSHARPRSAVS